MSASEILARRGAQAQQAREDAAVKRDQRRRLMPWSTEVVDDMRHNFGEVTFIKAEENGHSVLWNERNDITGTATRPVTE